MTGPLMLSGSHEHTPSSRTGDRALLASLDVARPRVVVVPAASGVRRRPAAAVAAVRYWNRMGVTVDVVEVDRAGAGRAAVDALRDADAIVLTGGHPTRLPTATTTAMWPHIVARWRRGAALAGSSAAAMVLCEWRQRLAPPRPLQLVRGFGPVPGCAAAPHFNRAAVRRWTLAASRARPDVTIVGLDEGAAIIWRHGRYTVRGTGVMSLIRAGTAARYHPGERLPDEPGSAGLGRDRFPPPWAPPRDIALPLRTAGAARAC